jgi:selenide,water dikinase
MNPWPIIGGIANVTCFDGEYQKVNKGKVGDILVLTKPLGTQPAVNLNEWLIKSDEGKLNKALKYIDRESAKEAYFLAVESMALLNKNAATLMRRHNCHGATDITGFGLKGHAKNLLEAQEEMVDFYIHTMPIIDRMHLINDHVFNFRLTEGFSAETSGGLLIMVPPDKVELF